ncbi:unnamed protein product [Didymodactylos carnosus]|uniref:Uncharacterized protein n=1 Tax=Didymodactylos carnosus TaxID=1234261 RepID=A0A8S2G0T3_9BILA|nr:unnamed protein product [Didymodactylos carnosus]CAF4417076.1 unnamed protein product [Didymodactylos carnosus]
MVRSSELVEVFTQVKDLLKINGNRSIWSYPSREKTLEISSESVKNGQLEFDPVNNESKNSTERFKQLLTLIKDGEDDISIREFALGLNEGMGKHAIVQDIFAFERQDGIFMQSISRSAFPKWGFMELWGSVK